MNKAWMAIRRRGKSGNGKRGVKEKVKKKGYIRIDGRRKIMMEGDIMASMKGGGRGGYERPDAECSWRESGDLREKRGREETQSNSERE